MFDSEIHIQFLFTMYVTVITADPKITYALLHCWCRKVMWHQRVTMSPLTASMRQRSQEWQDNYTD